MGIGNSVQKHQWLPYAENDFIFGVIGEELGFFGCVILIGAFAVLLIMGVMIALRAPDLYGMVLGKPLFMSEAESMVILAPISWVLPYIYDLFQSIRQLFML